jgi:predicted nucleic acid-binding protein
MRIFWDTNLFIYLWEDGANQEEVTAFADWIVAENHELVTSSLTVGEILVHPLQQRKFALAKKYEAAFRALEIVPFDENIAPTFAMLRAKNKSLRPPDAIQLACATEAQVDFFFTNDNRLSAMDTAGKLEKLSFPDWRSIT